MTSPVVSIGTLAAAKLRLSLSYLIRLAPEARTATHTGAGRPGSIRRRDLCFVVIRKSMARQPFAAACKVKQRSATGAECFDPVPFTLGPVTAGRYVLNQFDCKPLSGGHLLPEPVVNREVPATLGGADVCLMALMKVLHRFSDISRRHGWVFAQRIDRGYSLGCVANHLNAAHSPPVPA